MLAHMLRGSSTLLAIFATVAACGGATVTDPGSSAAGRHGTGSSAGRDGGTEASANRDGAGDGAGGYVEPTCPDAGPPVIDERCDPFNPHAGCQNGFACYPYVEYPDGGDPCAREIYGAKCLPEGRGTQGAACSSSLCAAGFACVDTGQGTQCAELCLIPGPDVCPRGLLCIPMDVEPGVGSCI
jgi:hypothetical protein